MSQPESTAPDGYCQCGCGAPAPIAKKTRRGYTKGEPMRFVQGHHMRVAEIQATVYTRERGAKISAAHADGRVPPCVECTRHADEWALIHSQQTHRGLHGGLTKPYSVDPGAYVPLCRSCHRTADRRGGYRARSVHNDH